MKLYLNSDKIVGHVFNILIAVITHNIHAQ